MSELTSQDAIPAFRQVQRGNARLIERQLKIRPEAFKRAIHTPPQGKATTQLNPCKSRKPTQVKGFHENATAQLTGSERSLLERQRQHCLRLDDRTVEAIKMDRGIALGPARLQRPAIEDWIAGLAEIKLEQRRLERSGQIENTTHRCCAPQSRGQAGNGIPERCANAEGRAAQGEFAAQLSSQCQL